jgi:hypothetical protein
MSRVPDARLPSLSNRKSEETRKTGSDEGSSRCKNRPKRSKIDQNWAKGTPKQAEFEDPLEIEVGRKSGIAGALNLIIEYAALVMSSTENRVPAVIDRPHEVGDPPPLVMSSTDTGPWMTREGNARRKNWPKIHSEARHVDRKPNPDRLNAVYRKR